jgi:regulator of protease activity HflC (stomatin/prohibitin superfamily)
LDIFTILAIIALAIIYKTFIVVPQEYAFIQERLGEFKATLHAGLHILIPVIDKVHYKHNLKEMAYDVPPQECITKDNVSIEVDGILYLKVIDPKLASYGIDNYMNATTQLAKTILRSEIGKLNLDDTFAEREEINTHVVRQIDHATDPWGIKVTRYEIRNITPPKQVLHYMEQKMKADRDRRAEITLSEGDRSAKINQSLGEKQEAINVSEGEKQKKINEAEGKAQEIELIAQATANGIRAIAAAISKKGGKEAVELQISQGYLDNMGKILHQAKTTVLPSNIANIAAVFEGLSKVTSSIPQTGKGDKK